MKVTTNYFYPKICRIQKQNKPLETNNTNYSQSVCSFQGDKNLNPLYKNQKYNIYYTPNSLLDKKDYSSEDKLFFSNRLSKKEKVLLNIINSKYNLSEKEFNTVKKVFLRKTKYDTPFFSNLKIDNKRTIERITDINLPEVKYDNHINLTSLFKLEDDKWKALRPYLPIVFQNINGSQNLNFQMLVKKYSEDKLDLNSYLEECSKLKIKSLLDNDSNEGFDIVISKLQKGDVESSNIELMLNLVKEGKLSPDVIDKGVYPNTKMTRNAEKDLDKLYETYITDKTPDDMFVPKFKSIEEAEQSTQTGDICSVENKTNIFIKNKDNILEELFISPSTYLELFPPVEKFSYSQNNYGDCFLISSIYSIFSNPNTRNRVLECFKENPDGTVDAAFCGYQYKDGEIHKNSEDSYELKDISTKIGQEREESSRSSNTSEAMRAFELLYKNENFQKAEKMAEEYYKKMIKAQSDIGDKDYIFIDDLKYSKFEIDKFIEFYNKNTPMVCTKLIDEEAHITDETDLDINSSALTPDNNKYINSILGRYEEYFSRTQTNRKSFDEVIPLPIFEVMQNCSLDKENLYIDGGCSSSVMNKLGFKSTKIESEQELNNILNDKDFNKKYILNGSSKQDNDEYNIIEYHQYTIEKIDEGKDKNKFALINPHNTSQQILIPQKLIYKIFSDLYLTKF